MILTKINPSEGHLLEFTLDIQGTIEKTTDVRFVIENGEFSLMFPATNENGKVTVKIPKLENTIGSGIHEAKLEVVIGDKLFTPLTESLEILPNVKVGIKESAPTVKSISTLVTIKQEDEFTISEEEGFKFLKKDGLYYGIISEDKTIKSNKGYSGIEELVDSLTEGK